MTTDPTRITETERPLRNEQQVQLQREIWHLMRRHATEKRDVQAAAARVRADQRDQFRALVTDLARAHHQLRVFVAQHAAAMEQAGLTEQAGLLATIHDRYGQVLTRVGAELVYHDGQPFTLDLLHSAEITASIPSTDVEQPIVQETVSPGVRLGSELVCKAEVQLAVPAKTPTTDNPSDPAAGGGQ